MLSKFAEWFTPERRQAIYNLGVSLFALALVAGWVAPEQVEKFQSAILTAGGAFALFTNVLASRNVNSQ